MANIQNKSVLGIRGFLREFYQDLKSGLAKGWWNERYARRTERIYVDFKDTTFVTVYDLVCFILENYEDLSVEDIKSLSDSAYTAYPLLDLKRVYFWEIEVPSTEDIELEIQEFVPAPVEEAPEPEPDEEVEEVSVPDFDYAKTLTDKQELKSYAKTFGYKIDSRKSLSDMMKSFQGKYHATKGK